MPQKLLNIRELKRYLSVGTNKAQKIGRESGARVKLGGRVLYDVEKINDYINTLRESQHAEM